MKMKVEWDEDLRDDDSQKFRKEINSMVKEYAKNQNIDVENVTEDLEKTCFKNTVLFPKPAIFKNVILKGVQYKNIMFNSAIVYSKEEVPHNCLIMPDKYQFVILGYYPKQLYIALFVTKRVK